MMLTLRKNDPFALKCMHIKNYKQSYILHTVTHQAKVITQKKV